MRLRGATEQATRSPDGDARAREHRTTRLPPRSRRRSLPWLLLGVLLVAGCALAFALASVRLSGRQPVLALARSVTAGHVLQSGDLSIVNVATDSNLALIPASSEPGVLGRPVALPLAAGTLLTETELGTGMVPPAGSAVVGVALKAGQYPPELSPGDTVLIVTAAGTGVGAASSSGTAPSMTATVVGIQVAPADSSAATVVSLQVSEADAPSVAAAGGSGDVSLVLVSAQGGGA